MKNILGVIKMKVLEDTLVNVLSYHIHKVQRQCDSSKLTGIASYAET